VKRKSLLSRLRNAPDQLRWLVVRSARGALGLDTTLDTEDRRILEGKILPWLAGQETCRRVLFVGCDWYTRHYERLFESREYWTIEKDPARRKWGGERHVSDSVTNLRAHFGPGSLDAIVMNGVLGWGLNEVDEAEEGLGACATCLDAGGYLVIGWNDIPEKRVLAPSESRALRLLEPCACPPLGATRHRVPGRAGHTYEFFRKPRGRRE
jgi:hypothetical protein